MCSSDLLRPEPLLLFTGMAVAVLVVLVTIGGAKRIGTVMERLVPVVAVAYLFGSAAGGIAAGVWGRHIPVHWLHRSLGILILWGGLRYLC